MRVVRPVKVGPLAKTRAPPVPVSSVTRVASSLEVSIEVEEILLLKIVQSLLVSNPRLVPEEEGILKVRVSPEPVTVKSVPAVEEAKVTVGPSAV